MATIFNEKTGSVYDVIGKAHEFVVAIRFWLTPSDKVPGLTRLRFRVRLTLSNEVPLQTTIAELLPQRFPKLKVDKVKPDYASVAGEVGLFIPLGDQYFPEVVTSQGMPDAVLEVLEEGIRGLQLTIPTGWAQYLYTYLKSLTEAPEEENAHTFDVEFGNLTAGYVNGSMVINNFDSQTPWVTQPHVVPDEALYYHDINESVESSGPMGEAKLVTGLSKAVFVLSPEEVKHSSINIEGTLTKGQTFEADSFMDFNETPPAPKVTNGSTPTTPSLDIPDD